MKNPRFLLIVVFLSLLPIIPYFVTSQLIHTHDGLVHLPRLAAYYTALSEWSIPVRYAGYLNYGYGLPLFNFIYQFPYWVGSLFILIGFGLVNAFKISITLSFILSGIFMYLFTKEYFEDDSKAFMCTILYQFAPFRMVEILVRGSYGEVYTYAFLPLVLYGLSKLKKQTSILGVLLTSLAVFLLVISHNSISLLFFASTILFVLVTFKELKKMIIAGISLLFGLFLSAFYWIPAVVEHKYTFGSLFMEKLFMTNFPLMQNFFIPNFTNDKAFQIGGISTFVGLFQLIAIVLSIYLLVKKKVKSRDTRRIFYFAFLIIGISLFFMMPISTFVWTSKFGEFLRQFQFPWRFLSLVMVGTALLGASFVSFKKPKMLYIGVITILTILSVAFYWRAVEGYDKIDEKYYWNFPLNTTYYGETDVIWSAGPAKSYPKQRVEFISSRGTITDFQKKNSKIAFQVSATTTAQLVSHTQYFPGWTVKVDGVKTPIQFQDPNNRGELVFDVPPGKHQVLIEFGESKIRFIADIISILSFVLLVPIAIFIKKYL